jgi:hypothetical protein
MSPKKSSPKTANNLIYMSSAETKFNRCTTLSDQFPSDLRIASRGVTPASHIAELMAMLPEGMDEWEIHEISRQLYDYVDNNDEIRRIEKSPARAARRGISFIGKQALKREIDGGYATGDLVTTQNVYERLSSGSLMDRIAGLRLGRQLKQAKTEILEAIGQAEPSVDASFWP